MEGPGIIHGPSGPDLGTLNEDLFMCEAEHPEYKIKCERNGEHDIHRAKHPNPLFAHTAWTDEWALSQKKSQENEMKWP